MNSFYDQGFKDGIAAGRKERILLERYLKEVREELAVAFKQLGNWREFPSNDLRGDRD